MAITSALSWPVQIDLQVYPETGIFTRLQRSGGGSTGSSMAAPHHRKKGKNPDHRTSCQDSALVLFIIPHTP
jgi:hypothetical protein